MGFFRRLFYPEKRLSITELDTWMDRAIGGYPTASSIQVNDATALSCMAVYAAVQLIAQTIGSLPGHVMRLTDVGKEKALTHPLYPIIHDRANPEQTALEWRETAMGHLLLRGNHYSEKQYDNAGRLLAIWPIHPDGVQIERTSPNAPLTYIITIPQGGGQVRLGPDRILHLRGMGSNGVTGFSPIAIARETIGLAIAAQEYGSRLFKNDGKPGGILEHPSKMSEPALIRLRASIKEQEGLENRHRTMILEEGMKWHQLSINPDDSQFLQSRQFAIAEIARMFNLPPHALGDLSHATFSNIEQQNIDLVGRLVVWLVRLEQRLKIELLSPQDQVTHFIKFNVNSLLRGDVKSRFEAYHIAKLDGIYNADEIRDFEDLNPIPGGNGQDYWQPVNMGVVGNMPAPQPSGTPDPVMNGGHL